MLVVSGMARAEQRLLDRGSQHSTVPESVPGGGGRGGLVRNSEIRNSAVRNRGCSRWSSESCDWSSGTGHGGCFT